MVFIKLRFAEINQWERILSEIFGKKIRVQSSNMSNEKTYSALYSLFKEFYRVPAWAYNRMINTREFRIYNSESEKEMYDAKWRNRLKD